MYEFRVVVERDEDAKFLASGLLGSASINRIELRCHLIVQRMTEERFAEHCEEQGIVGKEN